MIMILIFSQAIQIDVDLIPNNNYYWLWVANGNLCKQFYWHFTIVVLPISVSVRYLRFPSFALPTVGVLTVEAPLHSFVTVAIESTIALTSHSIHNLVNIYTPALIRVGCRRINQWIPFYYPFCFCIGSRYEEEVLYLLCCFVGSATAVIYLRRSINRFV